MKVLIACEFSGIVRDAFTALGHNATSCDLLPTESPGKHYEGDIKDILNQKWDLMIAHPPCTHLAGSGARWLTDHWVHVEDHPNKGYWYDGSAKRAAQVESVKFVKLLWDAPIKRICLENPVGMLVKLWRPWSQIIQPWQFGHGETKATCLWLKNLPLLVPTEIVSGRHPRVHHASPGPDRWKERSRTLTGIAKAMAEQWSIK